MKLSPNLAGVKYRHGCTATTDDMRYIAIYERDDLMHGLLREWLLAAGYCVTDMTARTDPIADVDLAIVSIAAPNPENEVLIRGARCVHRRAAIIALSSQARSGLSSNGAAARALGVERVMAKPLARTELLAAVESIIGPPDGKC
jgi:DNA-binding response OmpR family regulator